MIHNVSALEASSSLGRWISSAVECPIYPFPVLIPLDHWDWQDLAQTTFSYAYLYWFQPIQPANNTKLSTQKGSQTTSILCRHCDHILGTTDETAGGWRMQKWSVGIRSTVSLASGLPSTYSSQKWISARFLSMIENSGIRKFHIRSSSPALELPTQTEAPAPISSPSVQPIPSLLVWIFTPDLLFSSSIPSPNRFDPTRSMKIFYKKQTWQPLRPGDSESASIEDMEFPNDLYEELDDALRLSQRLLPPTAKKFQGWDVGLLERFDVAEVGTRSPEHEDQLEAE